MILTPALTRGRCLAQAMNPASWRTPVSARRSCSAFAVPAILSLGCAPLVLTVDDVLVAPGRNARLVAYVEREPVLGLRADVKGIRVAFSVDDVPVGDDQTDEDGRASVRYRGPPGGRVIEARVVGRSESPRAAARLFLLDRERVMIAVDIDKTISKTEYKELILEEEDGESDPIKGSRDVLRELSENFHIIYVTARPRFLLEKSRRWLAEHEFPDGPVIAAPSLRQALRQLDFKRRTLDILRQDWPALLIGIGDRPSDAEAYGANKMLTLIVHPRRNEGYGPHAAVFRDWKGLKRFFDANRDVLLDRRRLKEAVAGDRMLLRPVYPWKEGDD